MDYLPNTYRIKILTLEVTIFQLILVLGSIRYLPITIAGQKIVKALTFNGQRIVGLCKSLTVNAVNF
jgi:hypothetical protein